MATINQLQVENTIFDIEDTYARGLVSDVPNKANKDLSNVTGTLPINKGGTGATSAAAAS